MSEELIPSRPVEQEVELEPVESEEVVVERVVVDEATENLGPLDFNNPDDIKKFHNFRKRKR